MSHPKRSNDQFRKKIPSKWICLGLLIVVAIILHQIPQTMEVTLHVLTGRISFSLPETENVLTLIEGLPLTSLNLSGSFSLPLEVRDLKEGESSLIPPRSRITLKARSRECRFNFLGEKLRLQHLAVAPGATVNVFTDQERQVLIHVSNTQLSQVVIEVPERKFRLTVKDVALLNEHGEEIPFISEQPAPIHTLAVMSSFRNLIFEQQGENSFDLVMNFSRQMQQDPTQNIPLSFIPRLKVSQLHFTRKVGDKKLSEIRQLWIEPIIPEGKPEQKVYLETKESDIFTLQSLSLTQKGLECRLTGHTDTLKMGKDKPRKNRLPSVLSSILYSETFERFIKVIRDVGGIIR